MAGLRALPVWGDADARAGAPLPVEGADWRRVPEFRVPELAAPELAVPEFRVPEFRVPELAAPEFRVPELAAPEFRVPELAVPEFRVPELAVPEFRAPEFRVPELAGGVWRPVELLCRVAGWPDTARPACVRCWGSWLCLVRLGCEVPEFCLVIWDCWDFLPEPALRFC
jgi:hypothetical protein